MAVTLLEKPGNMVEDFKIAKPGDMVQDSRRKDKFAHLMLSPEQKGFVVMRKLESTDLELSDTQHDRAYPWTVEIVATPKEIAELEPRLVYENSHGDSHILNDDDGIIVMLHGTFTKMIYLDRQGNPHDKNAADELAEL